VIEGRRMERKITHINTCIMVGKGGLGKQNTQDVD
jgi:hypothetical protein